MAGGPCAKIFMTVECSLLSRQLMAPDDVWIFYFRLFVYLFIFFVAPREESRRRYIVSLNRDAQFAVSIDRSSESSSLFPFPSFQTIRGSVDVARHAFDLLESAIERARATL